MGIKKRLCNAPAEEVANNGDPEVRGMFMGAGRAAGAIEDRAIRREFEDAVVTCEAEYIASRKRVAETARAEMDRLFHDLLASVDQQDEKPHGR